MSLVPFYFCVVPDILKTAEKLIALRWTGYVSAMGFI